MTRPMLSPITASQTIGPYPHEGWRWAFDATAAVTSFADARVRGTLRDAAGHPIDDAVLEAWMPYAVAAEPQAKTPGFRRVATDAHGGFELPLLRAADRPAGEPIAYVTLFARGLLTHRFTAVWLDDDPHLDRAALLVPVPVERRATLIARTCAPQTYRWDLQLQTARETVFFDYA